jgi:hypothetical protein
MVGGAGQMAAVALNIATLTIAGKKLTGYRVSKRLRFRI